MRDNLTKIEKELKLTNAIFFVVSQGWQHIYQWNFKSPSGTIHDLSTADLTQLNYIESKKLFVI